MKLFKCLVPVLILLFVEDSSAGWCLIHRLLPFHIENSLVHRVCDSNREHPIPTIVPLTSNGTQINIDNRDEETHISGNVTINKSINVNSLDPHQVPKTNVATTTSKVNHIPNEETVPGQSGPRVQWSIVPLEAVIAGDKPRLSTGGGSGPTYAIGVPGDNSTSEAYANAGSSGVGGFGGNAGNTEIISSGSASSGSGPGGSSGDNAKADAVATTGASNDSWTDGLDAYRQGMSGGLSSATFNVLLKAFRESMGSFNNSTANGFLNCWVNAANQAFSSAISKDDKGSAPSIALTSAHTNV